MTVVRAVRRCAIVSGMLAVCGCGYTWGIEHAPLISGPGPRSGWMRVAGAGASYEVDIHTPPKRFQAGMPLPLIIVLHGSGGTGPGMERRTRFSELADSVGLIVAYPNARTNAAGRRLWGTLDSFGSDTAMLRALIDSVAARFALDRRRVYLTGFSNGGGMTYRAARVMPGVFAAIGVVAASGRGDSLRAADEPSIPLIAVHGMRDANVAFDGAGPAVRTWARRNGCDAGETIDTLDAGATVRTSYPSCPGSRAVAFYAMVNGGHGWPNAGVREAPFPTTLVMWSFFRESAMSSR